MRVITSVDNLRAELKLAGPVSFVPTMGNLHQGHASLVQMGRNTGLPTVVSLFVNRLQFGPSEDFDRYPRTLENDCNLLRAVGCDFVFAPSESDLYPEEQLYKVHPDPSIADVLEGEFRPGFFSGVSTVVMKLFNTVQPRVAIFGKKDYQQLLVVQRMVRQFQLPIDIIAGETSREEDGLARSSRNGYLTPTERRRAPLLSQVLLDAIEKVRLRATTDYRALESRAMDALRAAAWEPDYVALRRRADLHPALSEEDRPGELVLLAAARLGNTRLIDNMEC